MPDPAPPGRVKAVQRGARWVLVDEQGKVLAKQESGYASQASADAAARVVNEAWKAAAAARKARGAPPITQESVFEPGKHPRGRGGRWAGMSTHDLLELHAKGRRGHGHVDMTKLQEELKRRGVDPATAVKRGKKWRYLDSNDQWHEAKKHHEGRMNVGLRDPWGYLAPLQASAFDAALADIEEGAFALPMVGQPMRLKFDPRLHPRDRIGKFQEALAKLDQAPHGSTVELPHGHVVRKTMTGFQVVGGGEATNLATPEAAAAEGLVRHAAHEVERGADARQESRVLLAELGQARRQVASQDVGDYSHLDDRMRQIRLQRRPPQELASYVGRNAASRSTETPLYARNRPEGHPLHGLVSPHVSAATGASNLQRAFDRAHGSGARAETGREIDARTGRRR